MMLSEYDTRAVRIEALDRALQYTANNQGYTKITDLIAYASQIESYIRADQKVTSETTLLEE